MFQLPKQPQNIGQIYKTSFVFWGSHFFALAFSVAIMLIISAIPLWLFPELDYSMRGEYFTFLQSHLPHLLIFSVVMLWLYNFVIYRFFTLFYENKSNLIKSFFVAIKKLPYVIIAMLLWQLIVFIGIVLFIIPGIAFMVLLSMYFIAIIGENKNPFSGIKRSWQLVTDNWWHTFFVLFIAFVVMAIIYIAVDFVAIKWWVVAHPIGYGQLHLGYHLLSLLAGVLIYPLYISVQLVLFHDLKLRCASKLSSKKSI